MLLVLDVGNTNTVLGVFESSPAGNGSHTYGKLIGLNRTPAEIKKRLSTVHGAGVYFVYAGIE